MLTSIGFVKINVESRWRATLLQRKDRERVSGCFSHLNLLGEGDRLLGDPDLRLGEGDRRLGGGLRLLRGGLRDLREYWC